MPPNNCGYYDENTITRNFREGETVWLSAGKLDPHWEGGWKVKQVMSPPTVEITNGQQNKCVHINRLHHCRQPDLESPDPVSNLAVDHLVLPPAPRRYIPLTPQSAARSLWIPRLLTKGGASVAEHKHSHPLLSKSMSVGHVMVLLYNH